jgi:copper chaperone
VSARVLYPYRVYFLPVGETLTYSVPGMHCGHCKAAVERELSAVEGVDAVEADLDSKRVTVSGQSLSDDALREAIEEAGYEAA